jgi:Tol biopolymer transport system component
VGRLVVGVGVCVVGLVVALAFVLVTRGSSPARGIVFQAKVHGLYQLFRIDTDGTHLRQVTHIAMRNSSVPGVENPSWSPDGKKIVFDYDYQRTKQQVVSLFTIKPDGSDLAKVPLNLGQFVGAAAYSPDGKEISFEWDGNDVATHNQGIDIANSDGSLYWQLTALNSPIYLDKRSNWSPDGKWIAFTERGGPGQSVIIKIRSNGTGGRVLTRWALNANHPKWSPDGSRIAFNSHDDLLPGASANLYTISPKGGDLVQLTHYMGSQLNARVGSWSPDGKQLVFQLRGADPNGPGINQLFIINADGKQLRQLTHLPRGSDPGYASWSPVR